MKLWIARDLDGTLCLYTTEPWERVNTDYHKGEFDCDDEFIDIDNRLFPEVTFENSPQKVKLVSKNISESIVNEFMNTLNFTYDKSEKCMVAKIHNSDLTSLKNIIESNI